MSTSLFYRFLHPKNHFSDVIKVIVNHRLKEFLYPMPQSTFKGKN